jgi:hypothetical protein
MISYANVQSFDMIIFVTSLDCLLEKDTTLGVY